jgi:hypothetical protein
VFNLGVQGDETSLSLYVSRYPREAWLGQTVVSDLVRITYWQTAGGLARQEVKVATSDEELGVVPPNVDNEAAYVIAEDVKGVKFEYFNGQSWDLEWYGDTPGADGKTPIGPPAAIKITLYIGRDGEEQRVYEHVIAIPTANNFVAPPPIATEDQSQQQQQGTTSGSGG